MSEQDLQNPQTSNDLRAFTAAEMVKYYSLDSNYRYGEPDYEADIVDFLTDLRHLCERLNLDFEELCRLSQRHYEAEREEEEAKIRSNARPCPYCGCLDVLWTDHFCWCRNCGPHLEEEEEEETENEQAD